MGEALAPMMAGSHAVLGAAAWLAAAPLLGEPALSAPALALAIAGSLLPDIDHPKSWVGRRLGPLSALLGRLLGHRGLTHSLAAVAGCGWLLASHGVPRASVDPIVVGYLSHLLGDLLTPRGLRLAWPLKGTWSLPLCKSGSAAEPLVVAAILIWIWCGTGVGAMAGRELHGLSPPGWLVAWTPARTDTSCGRVGLLAPHFARTRRRVAPRI